MALIARTLQAELRGARWQPTQLWFPRKINGRWYRPGSRVYRCWILSPGGGFWQYGDDFDALRGSNG